MNKIKALSREWVREAETMKTFGIGRIAFLVMPALTFGCVYPTPWSPDHVWAHGSQVTVYLDSSFDSSHVQSIKQAFQNWEAHQPDQTAVSFTFVSGNAPDGINTYNVYNKLPSGYDPSFTRGVTGGDTTGDWRTNSYTYLNPAVSDPDAVLQLMVHEIGHTFGLKGAKTSGPKDTIMAIATCMNCSDGLSMPTPCDASSVASASQGGSSSVFGTYPGMEADSCSTSETPLNVFAPGIQPAQTLVQTCFQLSVQGVVTFTEVAGLGGFQTLDVAHAVLWRDNDRRIASP